MVNDVVFLDPREWSEFLEFQLFRSPPLKKKKKFIAPLEIPNFSITPENRTFKAPLWNSKHFQSPLFAPPLPRNKKDHPTTAQINFQYISEISYTIQGNELQIFA